LKIKKTDSTTCHDNAKTWKKIETEFNARLPNSCRRNSESLNKNYYNKKKELRKSMAEERNEILLTGGGPAKLLKKDASDNLLLSVMGDKTSKGKYIRSRKRPTAVVKALKSSGIAAK
jgi:hypothetical protein